jgi:hypothetical protein
VVSPEVKALDIPPRVSSSWAISLDVRLGVPLKSMCSTKWALPLLWGCSSRAPTSTQIPAETVREGIFSVMIRMPLSSTVFW